MQDKQYIALELTKISSSEINEKDVVFEHFKYHLEKVTNIIQDIETIESLQNEITRLKNQLTDLHKTTFDETGLKIRLKQILDDGKGDMEPYLFSQLYDIINR